MNSLIQRPSVQHYLLSQLSKGLAYEISSGPVEFSFWKGLGISASNVHVNLPGGYDRIIAERVFFSLDLGELLRGRVIPDGLTLVKPVIRFAMKPGEDDQPHDIPALLEAIPFEVLAPIPSLSLEGASISVKGIPVRMEDLFLQLVRNGTDPRELDLRLNGKILYKRRGIPVYATGKISAGRRGGAEVRWSLRAGNIPLSSLPCPDSLPVSRGTAHLDIRGKASSDGTLWVKGDMDVEDLEFMIIDNGDKKSFAFGQLHLPFHSFYSESKVFVPFFQMKAPDFTLNVDSVLDLTDRTDPHLELNVRAPAMGYASFRKLFPSSLLPPWVETRLLSLFSGGDIRVDLFSLNGRLDQLKNLDSPENSGALLLKLTCTGLTAFKQDAGIPVKGVSGRLEIKKGRIFVSEVKARFRDSAIDGGTLRLNSLYRDTPSIRVTVNGSFRVEDLLVQRNLSPVPDGVRQSLKGFESATGQMKAAVKIGYEPGWGFPRLLEGRIDFKSCVLEKEALFFPVFVNEGYITFEKGRRKFFVAEGTWGRSHILGSGVIDPSWRSGNANIVLNADMEELLSSFFPDSYSSVSFKHRIPSLISLSGNGSELAFRGSIDLENTSLETESMTIEPFRQAGMVLFSGKLRPGQKLCLTNLKCNLRDSSFQFNGSYDLREKDRFRFRVKSENLLLEDLGVRFKKSNLRGRGSLQFDVAVNGLSATVVSPAGQPVSLGDGTGSLSVARRWSPSTADTHGHLDLSAASSVSIDVTNVRLGTIANVQQEGDMEGILTLSQAGANTITATNITVGDSNPRGNTDFTSEINLGGVANVIDVDTMVIGGRKSKGRVDVSAGGTLTLGGKTGAAADVDLGINVDGTGTNAVGTLDTRGGTINATIGTLRIGNQNVAPVYCNAFCLSKKTIGQCACNFWVCSTGHIHNC